MKIPHCARFAALLAAGLAGYHYSSLALSADGNTFKVGQVAYAKRAAIACNSKEELQRAQDIAKQGDKSAFFTYLKGHCGAFDKAEVVKVLSIEPGVDATVVVVTDLDDPSAPSKLWMAITSLSLNK